MKNDKNICLREILACLSVLLTIAGQPVHANEFGLIAGAKSGYQRLALTYQTDPKWRERLFRHASGRQKHLDRISVQQLDRPVPSIAGHPLAAWIAPDTLLECPNRETQPGSGISPAAGKLRFSMRVGRGLLSVATRYRPQQGEIDGEHL